MRKTLAIAFALAALACLAVMLAPKPAQAADEFKWLDKLEDALAEANKSGKPIFLEIR